MPSGKANTSRTESNTAIRSAINGFHSRGAAALAALFLTGNVYAGWDTAYRTIVHIHPHDGGVTFHLDGDVIVAAAPCGNRFIVGASSPNYAAKIAALLSMHAQGRRIQIYYDSASTACDIPVSAFISEP